MNPTPDPNPDAPPPPPASQDRPRGRALRGLGWTLAGLLLLLAAAWAALQAPAAREALVRAAVRAAAGSDTARVELEGLGPGLPFTLSLQRLALADSAGPWLEAEGLELRWSAWPLLAGRLAADSLTARRIALTRLPQGGAGEAQPPAASPAPAPGRTRLLPRLRIRELAVDEVFLAAAVTDRDLRLAVRSSLRPEGDGLALALAAASLDGRPDRIGLDATLSRDLSALALDLRADEAPGGFLGWTLGLSDHIPLSASLAGRGGLEGWRGRFAFSAPGALEVAADLRLEDAGGLLLRGSGRVELAPDIAPARLEDLWRGGVDFGFTARPDLDGLLRVERLDLEGPAARAELAGLVHLLDLTLDARGRLALADPARLLAGSGFAVAGLEPLDLRATGEIEFMDLSLRGRARELRLHGLALAEPRLDLSARPPKGLYRRDPDLAVNATLAGPRLDLDGRLLAAEPALDAAMSTQDFRALDFPGIRLRARGLDLALDGRLDAATLAAGADLRLERWDGRQFPDGAGLPLSGRAEATIRADLGRLAGRAELAGRLDGLAALHPALAALAERDVPVAGILDFDRARLALSGFAAGPETARLTGSGDWSFTARDFRAAAALAVTRADALGRTLGLGLDRGLAARGAAQGRPGDFAAQAEIRTDALSLAGLDLGPARAAAELAGLPASPRGGISLAAATPRGPLDLAAGLTARPGLLLLRDIRGQAPGAVLSGSLDLDTATRLLSGRLSGEMRQPDLLRGLLGRNARGAATLDLALEARNATQAADLSLAARRLAGPDLRLESLDCAASLDDLWGRAHGEAKLSGQGLELPGLGLESFAAEARGNREQARFALQGRGRAGRPLDLAAQGGLAGGDPLRVSLESLAGSWDGRPIALAAPADLEIGADSLAVRGLDLDLAGGRLTAAGGVAPAGADLTLKARDLPLALASFLLPLPLEGSADADLLVRGAARDPDLALDLTLRQVARAGQGHAAPRLGLAAEARLRGGRLRLTAGLEGLGPERLALEAGLPLRCSLRPWDLGLPPEGELSGGLHGVLDPAALARLADLDGHALAGRAAVDLDLSGSPEAPALGGSIRLDGGRYENAFLGLLITDLEARIAARGRTLELRDLRGAGPEQGRIAGSGRLDLDPGLGFPFALDLNLDKLRAVRRDDLSLAASGRAGVAGNATAARIAGSLSLEPVEVRIPDRLPPDVPDLDIAEVNVAPARQQARPEAPPPALDLDTDLDLAFPGRCYVRGRGLDAEFRGRLRITGRPEAPAVNGALSVERGQYEFLGKTFAIASGNLVFDGASASPFLNVRGEAATADITAQVLLVGPARSFSLTLESDPALPQDEILARLLFGRSTAGLNPVQAAQLANAVRVFTLGGPSLDPTSAVRQALGLDQFGVAGAEGEKGPSLTMGKYLRENVYIEVRQDLTKGGEEVSLEVELAPNLGVESTTGAERSGVGLNWKKDY
ncbi:MAG: translocation/assembly module TamB domain-containing protein [Thermodesulfobacteriota bacterium]